ncbi:DUF4062 domain-containing protein [Arthrobacter sp. I2-34]|uniref:DUF4062 domain-containing protein n=1 Tax=Arthrobacter hankyongi TaxID=2904801 RepID=A0ABS9LDF4_9MICC|nr:DUF4062 domain-containing protein [Arthrobacter hankyongi]MCG2624695.1 DUF4062 domain-containing protein [Arthrobacter hankyongi]
MASPTVFVSSTFYDLRYPRESLKRFIETLGYTPILSEEGTVFYDPRITAAESCLKEVSNADIFVLLIGGRYGSILPNTELSVTNGEFMKAVERKIPVFAMVEQGTYSDYSLYRANVDRPELISQLSFPNADSVKIFEFIDSVQSRTLNNALVPFVSARDIESYLRSQWAGMMHGFLTDETREAQVVDTLSVLTQVNERVELITEQILRSVGTPMDRVYVRLLQEMVQSSVAADLRFIGTPPTPGSIVDNETVKECVESLGGQIAIDEDEVGGNTISGSGRVSPIRMKVLTEEYQKLRIKMLKILEEDEVSTEKIREYELESV